MSEGFPVVPDDFDPGEGAGESAAVEFAAVDDQVLPVIKRNAAAVREHRLLFPIVVDGKRLVRIVVRLPAQGDIDDWADRTLPDIRAIVLRLTGLHSAVLKALTWQDSEALHLIVQDLLPAFIVNSEPAS
ncbi:hypothetical protein [Shinella sp.]|jgi:hypothetical protein|uniref:hypothetical protein n=1 Tax=Shinella sp. TaxID=1870904 RepID=UPI003F72DF80